MAVRLSDEGPTLETFDVAFYIGSSRNFYISIYILYKNVYYYIPGLRWHSEGYDEFSGSHDERHMHQYLQYIRPRGSLESGAS